MENNKLQVKTVVVWAGIVLMAVGWGMTIQATLSNVRLNERAIERLDDIKADKLTLQSEVKALNVCMETLKEMMSVYLKQIDEKLSELQNALNKPVIKENGDGGFGATGGGGIR